MKRVIIACATFLLRVVYHFFYYFVGPRRQIVCFSRQSNIVPIDFDLIRSYVERNHPAYRVLTYAKKIDNPIAYIPHMLLQTYRIATSEAILLDSYCIVVSLLNKSIKAPVIQLWHAMGNMKRFGYAALDEPEGSSSEIAHLMHMHEGYDCVVISSMEFIDDYVAGFNVRPEIVFESPLPKADLLVSKVFRRAKREEIILRYPQLGKKVNIVYCPTFRKSSGKEDGDAIERLADCIDFNRYNLIYKRHPVSSLSFRDHRVLQDYDSSLDMLYVADYVITDYSTVMYEAGLLGVPVLLYIYDWKTYKERRGLNIDFSKDIPAPSSADPKFLFDCIRYDRFDREAFREFIDKYVKVPKDESCTGRIVEHVFSLMREA